MQSRVTADDDGLMLSLTDDRGLCSSSYRVGRKDLLVLCAECDRHLDPTESILERALRMDADPQTGKPFIIGGREKSKRKNFENTDESVSKGE